jgi:hypothetical protein
MILPTTPAKIRAVVDFSCKTKLILLKSGYHHIDIHPDHQQFLGFSWNFDGVQKYYVFNVLPFGISSAGHIFTKVRQEASC